jgi:hypothetical protein
MLYILDLVNLFYMIYILVLIWKLPNYLTVQKIGNIYGVSRLHLR